MTAFKTGEIKIFQSAVNFGAHLNPVSSLLHFARGAGDGDMSAVKAVDDENEEDVRVLLLLLCFQILPGHAGSLKCNHRNLPPQGKQEEKKSKHSGRRFNL